MATVQQNRAEAVVAEPTGTMSPLPLSAESILYPPEFTKLEGEVVLLRESVSKQQPDIHTLEELLT
ncbi:unnamed protein product, partial [Coregonus sp. 'balchen']